MMQSNDVACHRVEHEPAGLLRTVRPPPPRDLGVGRVRAHLSDVNVSRGAVVVSRGAGVRCSG